VAAPRGGHRRPCLRRLPNVARKPRRSQANTMPPRKRARGDDGDAATPPQPSGPPAPSNGPGSAAPQQPNPAPDFTDRREGMAAIARKRAAHFAHFSAAEDADAENIHAGGDQARTLGPWSSAVELVNAREKAQHERQVRAAQRPACAVGQGSGTPAEISKDLTSLRHESHRRRQAFRTPRAQQRPCTAALYLWQMCSIPSGRQSCRPPTLRPRPLPMVRRDAAHPARPPARPMCRARSRYSTHAGPDTPGLVTCLHARRPRGRLAAIPRPRSGATPRGHCAAAL
jgi:hypothetical protein